MLFAQHSIGKTMRTFLLSVMVILISGCTYDPAFHAATTQPIVQAPVYPNVQIQGIDGTQMAGQLLNGSVTIDCGQGALTLLTDHIYYITFGSDGDTVASKSVKATGKIREIQFNLQTEHGVFVLQKERLSRIDFPSNPAPAAAPKASATTAQ
jgi:hypothetical protein